MIKLDRYNEHILRELEFVGRIGARRMTVLRSAAVTSPSRYRAEGYLRRVLRNQYCLMLYFLGRPVEDIATVYYPHARAEDTDGEELLAPALPVKGEKDHG